MFPPFVAPLLAGLSILVASGAGAQSIAITDMEGRDVRLARPAERIASIPFPMASTVIAFDGATTRVVGMNPGAKTAMVEGIFSRMFPGVREIRTDIVGQGFMPNVEGLAAIQPDLVLQWGGRGDDIVRPLLNAGLTTMLLVYGQEQEVRTYMGLIATTIGKPERAQANIAWRDRVLATLKERVGAIPESQRPKVIHLTGAMTTMAVLGLQDHLSTGIAAAGGINAATGTARYATPTNREQIAAWDPDIITLNDFEDELTPEFIYRDPVLSLTKAARNRQVYKFARGGYRWEPPSHESPLAWMWLANLFHPDRARFDLRAETRAAYQAIYGYAATEEDLDQVLRLAANTDAAGYGQFRRR